MTYKYQGTELAVFSHAENWKNYWLSRIRRHIQGSVLEVGAGIGSNTVLMRHLTAAGWTCLEPDTALAQELTVRVRALGLPGVNCITGTVATLPAGQAFDTILYIDVLEHIEDDCAELERAAALVRPGGRIIVLSPAHQFLFSPFDTQIGHYRRYSRRTLLACGPPDCELVTFEYLDSFGLVLSFGNRLLLRQSAPSISQIRFWDRRVVPVSRAVDGVLRYRLGKTALSVWQKHCRSSVTQDVSSEKR